MKEVEPDSHWLDEVNAIDEHKSEVLEALWENTPNDAELITITLLSRLYDIGMAILTHLDDETAGKIFDAHKLGENFNPPMFIPDLKVEDE